MLEPPISHPGPSPPVDHFTSPTPLLASQERATKYSHGNTARLAAQYGDATLSKVCGVIAADEGRHEIAYTRIVEEFFRLDPEGAMSAYADMMRKQITMPAHLMDDQQHGTRNTGRNLFADFSAVTEKLDGEFACRCGSRQGISRRAAAFCRDAASFGVVNMGCDELPSGSPSNMWLSFPSHPSLPQSSSV